MSQAAMCLKVGLWSGLASPVSILTVLPQTWSGMVTLVWFVVYHWSSWRWYSVWTVHDNVTIFSALILPNVRAMSCHMSWFLTLQAAIPFDITLTVEGGMIIAVSCCTEFGFFTSKMASVSVWGPFLLIHVAKLWAFFSPLTNILIVAAPFVKLHLFASVMVQNGFPSSMKV